MKRLLVSLVVSVGLLSGGASSVRATSVSNLSGSTSSVKSTSVSKQRVHKQRDHVIYHVRRNRITNRSNRSKIVVIRFNGHKEAEFKIKKHETVRVFGRYSKTPTILNHTQKFLTKHGIKVTYNFQNNFSRKW